MPRKTLLIGLLLLVVPLLIVGQQVSEKIDLNVIHKIKTAEVGGGGRGGRAPVMEILYNLTDRYGPRLTNSPQFRAASIRRQSAS